MKKAPVHALALYQSHGASVAIGQHGLAAAAGNAVQALGDIGQGFIPAHGFKLAAALGAAALERGQQALGVVAALGVFADLAAQHAAGVWVGGVALYLDGNAALYRGNQRAGVGAVMRAGAHDGGGGFGAGSHGVGAANAAVGE